MQAGVCYDMWWLEKHKWTLCTPCVLWVAANLAPPPWPRSQIFDLGVSGIIAIVGRVPESAGDVYESFTTIPAPKSEVRGVASKFPATQSTASGENCWLYIIQTYNGMTIVASWGHCRADFRQDIIFSFCCKTSRCWKCYRNYLININFDDILENLVNYLQ